MKPIKCWAILISADSQGSAFLLGWDDSAPEIYRTREEVRREINEWPDRTKFKPRPVRVTITVDGK